MAKSTNNQNANSQRDSTKKEPNSSQSERLVSIDALRGFDMLWIVGGDHLATCLLQAGNWSFSPALLHQLEHVEWEGFVFYDLIFPLFVFLVGCVLPFSLEKYRANPRQVYGRIVRRTALLFLCGLIYSDFLKFDFANQRYLGVLQRIALAYGCSALLLVHTGWKVRLGIFAGILLGYWAILSWVPFPGGITGDLSKAGNLSGYIDRTFLPGKILPQYYGYGDNEGILSTLPAVATALLGVFAGEWLRSRYSSTTKVTGMVACGLACLAIGYAWNFRFPIIKNLWSSSFVLYAGGWSLLLLAMFYLVIDVWKLRKWSFVFVVVGMNAITIYLAKEIIDFEKISTFFLVGIASRSGVWRESILALGMLVFEWWMLYFLYRHRVFLRV